MCDRASLLGAVCSGFGKLEESRGMFVSCFSCETKPPQTLANQAPRMIHDDENGGVGGGRVWKFLLMMFVVVFCERVQKNTTRAKKREMD
jgi:hypothetical protein